MPFSGAGGSTFLGLWDDIEHPGLELEVGRRGGGEMLKCVQATFI